MQIIRMLRAMTFWRGRDEPTDNYQSRTLSQNRIYVRVKTSRPLDPPNRRHFVFNIEKGNPPRIDGIEPNDFTVLVGMGAERNADEFYIVPTTVLRKEMYDRWRSFFGEDTKKGSEEGRKWYAQSIFSFCTEMRAPPRL